MNFPYFPQTGEDISSMLEKCGLESLDGLYSDVPGDFIYRGEYDLPESMSEVELREFFAGLDAADRKLKCFVGQGAFDHYAPAVIPALISRSEFLTAYTPYQAEISQGTLRYIFEYQSVISTLTGMDVANASMYDGATSAAEAMLMAFAATKKKTRVLLSNALLPNVRKVVETYCGYHGIEVTEIPAKDGETSRDAIAGELEKDDVAGVLVPSINRFGIIENLEGIADDVHARKALLAVYADPSALGVLRTPGEWGAYIACGDAQPLGIPLSYGGPYIGFLATKNEYLRKLPGRIVGATEDVDGKRAFVLTLQAREQHIRREKATSNICSNQSLMALYVTIYASLMGAKGLKEVNDLSYSGAHYLASELVKTGKFEMAFPDKPFLKEFALKSALPAGKVAGTLLENGIFGAYPTEEGYITFAVTEKRTKEEIDSLVQILK